MSSGLNAGPHQTGQTLSCYSRHQRSFLSNLAETIQCHAALQGRFFPCFDVTHFNKIKLLDCWM